MADNELNIITSDANSVNVNTEDNTITITNDGDTTTVTLSAAETTTVQIATIGPKGDKGDVGNIDATTLATTGSNTFNGNQIISGSLNVTNGITGSLLGTASFAVTASYALNAGAGAGFPFSGSAVITGSLLVTGGITGSFSGSVVGYVPNEATTSFVTNNQTSSMTVGTASYYAEMDPIFTSKSASLATTGSNTFRGNQTVTGSLFTSGSNTLIGTTTLTGSFNVSGSTNQIGNNTLNGNTILSGSIGISGSSTIQGTTTMTGSLLITGSTTQTGNNTLIGNTTLSGSIIISGSTTSPVTPTIKVYGDMETNGVIKFMPVDKSIDTSISASYVYVSGSTNDLYFSQNGNGYNNTTRLRWLEGNLYTGLLYGGVISATVGGTTFNVSSGSGIIVTLNATTGSEPYPTINYVNWGNFTNQTITNRTTAIQTYVGIDSNGQIIQQTNPWNDGQYNTSISLGTVIHQNLSTVNSTITYPNTGYGYKQRTYDFIKAFGPLKLSGYPINQSGSLGLTIGSGSAFADGRNYQIDPNNPSYITDNGTSVSKIFRYYQSGSSFVQDTNNALGYTDIDSAYYNPNGAGNLVTVSPSKFTVQRVFWYPNSATKGIVVYYGLTEYQTLDEAQSKYTNESFVETPNTQQNAVFLGIVIIKGGSNFRNSNNYRIVQSSLFRAAGTGGGSGGSSAAIENLTDVTLTTLLDKQSLVYDLTSANWINSYQLSGSVTGALYGTASWATNALTTSFAPNYVLNSVTSSMLQPYVLSTQTGSMTMQNLTVTGTASIQYLSVIYETASVVYSSGSNQFGDATNDTQTLIGTVIVSGSQRITGSLNVSAGITGSLFGTASFYQEMDPIFVARSASLATTGSNTFSGNQIISGSFTVFTGSAIEFQVLNTGVKIGNAINDVHTITGSLRVSGSQSLTGSKTISVSNGGTGITIRGSVGSVGLAVNTLGGLNGTGLRTHILLGQTAQPNDTDYAIYSSLNMRSYLAGTLEIGAGSLVLSNNLSPIRLGTVGDTAADGTYGQFMMSTGANSRPQWTTITMPTVPVGATADEINLGEITDKYVTPAKLQESKYSTHNIFNYINFT